RRPRDPRQPRAPPGQRPRAAGPRRGATPLRPGPQSGRVVLHRRQRGRPPEAAATGIAAQQAAEHVPGLLQGVAGGAAAGGAGREDGATGAELGAAYARVGEITEQVGTRASALEALERARAIREALMAADPSAAGPLRDLAGVLETIGILQSRTSGREAEALPTLERALALREAVPPAPPDPA